MKVFDFFLRLVGREVEDRFMLIGVCWLLWGGLSGVGGLEEVRLWL